MVDRTAPKGIPSLPRNRRKSLGMIPSTHASNSASIDLLLSIPDPPTPDERSTAKTAAAALSLRTRRKSSSFIMSSSTKIISKPFVDVTNDLYDLTYRNYDKSHGTPADKGGSNTEATKVENVSNINDSNMELVDDADETVLDDGDSHEFVDSDDFNEKGIDHEGSCESHEVTIGDDIEFDADTGICFHDDVEEDEVIDNWSSEMEVKSPSELITKKSDSPISRKRPRQSMILPEIKDVLAHVTNEPMFDENDWPSEEKTDYYDDLASPQKKKNHFASNKEDDCSHDENVDIEGYSDSTYQMQHNAVRRSRKSIILPRREDIQQLKSSSGNISCLLSTKSEELSFETQENSSTKTAEMQEIKSAIRRFCALPVNERFKSDDAIFVQKQTGYPLLTAMDHYRRNNSHMVLSSDDMQTLTNSMKRDILQGMGPMCQIMEQKKRSENEMLESFTGCRSERRKGKYRYISISTGRKVKSSDYERLYLKMLEDHKKQRMLEMETESNAIEKTSGLQEDGTALASNIEGNDADVDQEHRISEANEDTLETTGNDFTEVQDIDDSIPSQDEISSDPEIAAAQLKLFATFDAALKEYSDTILAIRKKRASKTQLSVN